MDKSKKPTNFDYSKWSFEALRFFILSSDADTGYELRKKPESVLIDLLKGLMHWSGPMNIDFDAALERAKIQYNAEIEKKTAPVLSIFQRKK